MNSLRLFYLPLLILPFLYVPLHADIRLPSLFGSHMVLQRDQAIPVWGTGAPGEKITVVMDGQSQSAQADATGKWKLKLNPISASDNKTMTVTGSATAKPVNFTDVAVGEVWLCSGQSNMQFHLSNAGNAATELPQADNPQLRLFDGNSWNVSSPATAANFSAVGYFFGKEINSRLNVPVGMMGESVGGTPIQAWTPESVLRALPALQKKVAEADANARMQKNDPKTFAQKKADNVAASEKWPLDAIASDRGTKEKWFAADLPTDRWDSAKLPMNGFAEGFNDLGTVWYRRTVDIPASWAGKPLIVNLPGIDDVDITYINGQEIGRTWYSASDFWKIERHYSVPANLVTSTKLSITILVLNKYGIGGVFGKDEELSLALTGDASTAPLPLAGSWLVRRGSELDMKAAPQDSAQTSIGGNLYREKIAPIQPYAIKGVLWYQGENNADEPELYKKMFPAMIQSWREAWGEGDFPFYFVSLAGYMGHQEKAVEKQSWAEIREAQLSGLTQPHTAAAMAYDIGDVNDIHPTNKMEVGHRLAAQALARTYGMKIESQGPTFEHMSVEGDKVRLTFSHAKGLAAKSDTVNGFAIAGPDKIFHFATAKIEGNAVILSSADGGISKPIAVRYGWSSIPSGNLYNSDGFPAVPFRTDSWTRDDFSSEGAGLR